MTGNDSSVTRRSVLKTTGAALGVGLGATGTAAASCSEVRVVNDIALYEGTDDFGECRGDLNGVILEAGTEHYVLDTCTDADNDLYYLLEGHSECSTGGWVGTHHLECIDSTGTTPCFGTAGTDDA